MFVFVFFVVINLIRFVLIQIVIFVEFKVKLELVLVKLIIEKLEIFKLVEKVGKLGIFFLLQICLIFIGFFKYKGKVILEMFNFLVFGS